MSSVLEIYQKGNFNRSTTAEPAQRLLLTPKLGKAENGFHNNDPF